MSNFDSWWLPVTTSGVVDTVLSRPFKLFLWRIKSVSMLLFCMYAATYSNLTSYLVPSLSDVPTFTLSQCTLAGPVYAGMPLECHWKTQCTLEYHWVTQRILAGYTWTPLEKLSWNSPILECTWRNLVESGPHWEATGETLTFAAYTGTRLEGLWQPTHTPTHIVKHAE